MGGGRSVGGDGCPGATALRLRLRSVAPGHPWVGWLYLKPPSFLSRHWGGVYSPTRQRQEESKNRGVCPDFRAALRRWSRPTEAIR